jgi:hypothetical protein
VRTKAKGWLAAAILITIAAVLVVPYYLLPRTAARIIGSVLRTELGGTVEVSVGTNFGWELVFGRFPAVEIAGAQWTLDGLPIDCFSLRGRNVQVDLSSLVRNGRFAYLSAADLQVELRITEKGLNQYFWEKIDPERRFRIDLARGRAFLHGELELWQTRWNVSLICECRISKPAAIVMVPVEFMVFDTRVPDILLEIINENYRFQFNLGRLPIPINLESIELFDEYLVLHGSGA